MSKKSACKAKLKYADEATAQKAADKATEFRGVEFKIYNCPVCQGWHTTTKK
jgi:hypothetical protein